MRENENHNLHICEIMCGIIGLQCPGGGGRASRAAPSRAARSGFIVTLRGGSAADPRTARPRSCAAASPRIGSQIGSVRDFLLHHFPWSDERRGGEEASGARLSAPEHRTGAVAERALSGEPAAGSPERSPANPQPLPQTECDADGPESFPVQLPVADGRFNFALIGRRVSCSPSLPGRLSR